MTNGIMPVIYWGAGSEWLWAFGQFVIVAATLAFIAVQVWLQTRQTQAQTTQTEIQTKQTQLQAMSHVVQSVCTIQERWHSEAMLRVRLKVCHQTEAERNRFDGACEHVANYFEELGSFVKIGAIPKETMWDVQSWNVEYYWCMFEKGIEGHRKEWKEKDLYCDFENLFRSMRKISDAKGAPSPNEASIGEFVKREISAINACLDAGKGVSKSRSGSG